MDHRLSYTQAWCVAAREGALAGVIDNYKFHRLQAADRVLADLFAHVIPEFEKLTIIPVPAAPSNVRIRGYDHMVRIASHLAKQKSWAYEPLLRRQNNITQHFAKTLAQRKAQATKFFALGGEIDPDASYLLIDDIYTTGSTLEAAAACLRSGGANTVYAAVLVRHLS